MATIELLAPAAVVTGNAVPLDRVEEVLQSGLGVSRIIRYDKKAAALPAPDEMLEAAARECDVVINGIAD
jgi:hypothetical protein